MCPDLVKNHEMCIFNHLLHCGRVSTDCLETQIVCVCILSLSPIIGYCIFSLDLKKRIGPDRFVVVQNDSPYPKLEIGEFIQWIEDQVTFMPSFYLIIC